MLIHIVPKLYETVANADLLDVSIPELGLHLIEGKDITARRPYPNKRYLVACRKKGRKATEGLLMDVQGTLQTYTVVTRWMVNARVITHIVEHKVLDQDFDAVSDSMTLWYAYANKTWQRRWPQSYTETPLVRQPRMDILTAHGDEQSARPSDVRDAVCGQSIIARLETFMLHTIERERLFDDRISDQIPGINDAFSVSPVAVPDMTVELADGLSATLILAPMPPLALPGQHIKANEDESNLRDAPEVYLIFRRAGEIVGTLAPWNTVITGANSYRIDDNTTLNESDLEMLDDRGWIILSQFGLFPSRLVYLERI